MPNASDLIAAVVARRQESAAVAAVRTEKQQEFNEATRLATARQADLVEAEKKAASIPTGVIFSVPGMPTHVALSDGVKIAVVPIVDPTTATVDPAQATPKAPAAPPSKSSWWGLLGALAGAAMLATAVYVHEPAAPKPSPISPVAPTETWAKLGFTYAPGLLDAYGGAYEAWAAAIEAGKSVPEAAATFASTAHTANGAAVESTLAPALSKVLPEGADPTGDQRKAVAAAARGIATGLRARAK